MSAQDLNNAVNALGQALNYRNQKKAIEYQKDINEQQLEFAKDQFEEGKRQFNESMDWAKSESERNQSNVLNQISNTVSDAEKNGINPLAVLGTSASVGSTVASSGGNVAGSYNPTAHSPAHLDISQLASLIHDTEEKKKDRELVREEHAIRRKEIARQETRDYQDFMIASEGLTLEERRIDEAVRSALSNEEIQRNVLDETKRFNMVKETLERLGLESQKAQRALEQAKNDDEFKIAMAKIEQEKAKLAQEKDLAKRKNRMEYITRLTHTLVNAAVRVADMAYGKQQSAKGSNPIGFFAD